jgi:hypothetical protein
MMKPRISLFAEHEREDRRTKIGDPLVGLTKHVDYMDASLLQGILSNYRQGKSQFYIRPCARRCRWPR